MIYCPECGTANRDGSKFCNECGHRMSVHTGVKCQQCGTFNPVQAVFCGKCGGRLMARPAPGAAPAPAPIKGLSLPTRPTFGEEEEAGREPETPETPGEKEEAAPAWLRELGATLAADSVPAVPAAAQEAEELPDWLRDLGASLPKEPEAELPPAGEGRPPSTGEDLSAPPMQGEPSFIPPAVESQAQQPEEAPDWLAQLQQQAGAAAPVEPAVPAAEGQEEVPDWLAGLRSPAGGPPSHAPTPAAAGPEAEKEEELPEWLAELRPSAAAEGPATAAALAAKPEAEKAEAPDSPAEPQPRAEPVATGETLTPAAEPEMEQAEELPEWLAELRPSAGGAAPRAPRSPASEPVAKDAEKLPDWLAELRPPAGGAAPPATATPPAEPVAEEAEELPEWLSEIRPSSAASAAATPAEAAPLLEGAPELNIEAAEMPDWLADLQPPAAAVEPAAEPDRPLEAPAGAGPGAPVGKPAGIDAGEEETALPGWLADLRPKSAVPAPKEVPPAAGAPGWLSALGGAPPPEDESLAAGELPDWLVPSAELGAEEETLARAEIPAWLLALKPRELKTEGEAAEAEVPAFEEAVETTGLLAGIKDVLPVEMMIAQPRAAAPGAPEAALVETPEARLFAEIVALPLASAPKIMAKPAPRILSLLPWWIVYAVLLAVVAVPLLLSHSSLERTITPSPDVTGAYQAIESLDSNAPVLVAFDYDPATSGEMDVVAESIIGHLIDRQARIVVVSLLPTGPAMAHNLVAQVSGGKADYQPGGARYANLGFLPGQASSVRLMAQSLLEARPRDFSGTKIEEIAALDGVTTTRSFALIVELAAGSDTMRWWIEQAGTPYGLPLMAGVSAMVDPLARPYFESGSPQLKGIVGGVIGAASYETLRSGQSSVPEGLAARLDSQLAGQLVVVVVLLGGNIVYLARRGMRRE